MALRLCLFGDHSRETPLRTAVAYSAAVALVFSCIAGSVVVDALAASLESVELEGASQPLMPGDRIQGLLARPDGAGPFAAVIGLHGCAGMHETTKRKLADDLVGWGYVTLLVDSFGTRDIDHACTYERAGAIARRRTADAYGALAFLARQPFVDTRRVAAVGFSQGGWITLSVAETCSFEPFVLPSNLRFRAAVAFYPPCRVAGLRPGIPTLILIGAVDDWTPSEDCSRTVVRWGIGTTDRASCLSRHSPRILLSAPPARQDSLWSLGGIQRRRSGQCKRPDAAISQSPSQRRACQYRQRNLISAVAMPARRQLIPR
jgi:dienelactone hydrolase